MLLVSIFVALITLVLYGIVWCIQRRNFWKNHKVPTIPSAPLFGHFGWPLLLQEQCSDTFSRLYNHPDAKGQPFVGVNLFHKPAILVRDPELVKRILIKDFNYFNDRSNGADPIHDPIGANNLFQVKNPKWRKIRLHLTPVFTSGKMKQMFYMIEKVSMELKEKIAENQGKSVDARNLFGSFTTDVISLVAFGTDGYCIKHPDSSEFLLNAKKSAMSSTWSKVSFATKTFMPELFQYFKMSTFHPDFTVFLEKLFNDVTGNRIKSGVVRNDLIDALIAIKESEEDKALLTDEVVLAQAVVFFAAGFETSTSTLMFAFYHLSKDKTILNKIKEEIRLALVKNKGNMSYENLLHDLNYLDAVLKETLRLHPPVPFLDRECVLPGYSLKPYSNFEVPKKMAIFIPSAAMQMDPEYFPNPEKFDPSRFESGHVSEYTFMPFGIGPHNCIGERFALMQIKCAMFTILRSYDVSFADAVEPECTYDKTCILCRFNGPLNVRFTANEILY